MTTSPARAAPPVPWRRSALTAGTVATTAWIVLLVLALTQGSAGLQAPLGIAAGWIGLLGSFVTTQLLGRMWSGPAYAPHGPRSPGRRLALGFDVLLAVLIVLGFLGSPGGVLLQAIVASTALAGFLGAFVLALPRPPAH
jgi:hypothetical protein